MNPSPLIVAHRGASAHAPENTLAAFQMAIEAGSNGVEFDVRIARDGVPMVIHDATLERTGLRAGSVSGLTSHQLADVSVGDWFNVKFPHLARPEFATEKIPTLSEVLDIMAASEGLIYIELKCGESDRIPLTASVCDVVRNSRLLPRMIVKSFDLAVLFEVKARLPQVQTAALFEPRIADFLRRRNRLMAIAQEFGANQLSLHYSLVTQNFAASAAKAGMPITIWTVDDTKWIERGRRLGVRALITNDPSKLVASRDRTGPR